MTSRFHSDSKDSIADALDRLREELAAVRLVLDEIHVELQWANRNQADCDRCAMMLRRFSSLPLDLAVLDRFAAADLPVEDCSPTTRQQGQLF